MEQNLQKTNKEELAKLIPAAGTLILSTEQKNCLYEKTDPKSILVRPDGLIYMPWYEYAKRLNSAFTPFGWVLIPLQEPKIDGNFVYWWFALVVNGILCGSAIGGQEYIPSNQTMNWGDCCEAAKSNALMRICKELGMFLELWDKEFGDKWKNEYAFISGYEIKGDKKLPRWKKKTGTEESKSEEPAEEQKPTLENIKKIIDQHAKEPDIKKMKANMDMVYNAVKSTYPDMEKEILQYITEKLNAN